MYHIYRDSHIDDMATIIDFGKYRSRSIASVFETDPDYCRWLKRQQLMMESHPEIKAFLDEKLNNSDGIIIRFGKHRNKGIKWIQVNDPSYFTWLSKNVFVRHKCPAIMRELARIESEHTSHRPEIRDAEEYE